MIRLLVCDDSAQFRASLRATLAEQPEISIVAEAADGQEAVDLALALSPDAVLMDVAMPVMDGIEATRRIREALPDVRVVALTGHGEREVVAAMLAAGATAYCVKGAPLWELERVLAGAAEPLVRLAHTLVKSATAAGASELVSREITELTGAAAAVYLAAPDVGLSLAAAAGGAARAGLNSAPGVVLSSFRGQRLVLANARELSELAAVGLPCGEALAVPLLDDGETLGVVLAAMPCDTGLQIDHELVAAVADLAAAAVTNERRVALTHDEARRDSLTGLPNRRAFEERLDALLAGPGCEPFALALLDLDDFKRVNDTQGHQAGDDVLREVARVVARRTRAHEEVYRLGGDELAVVVAGEPETAELVANRLSAALRAHRRGIALPTASGGVAGYPADARTKDDLLAKADLALYAAKAEGGDRIVLHLASPEQESRPTPEATPSSAAPEGPARRASGAQVVPFPGREPSRGSPQPRLGPEHPTRVLVVDDDKRLRMLLRTTLEVIDIEIEEAGDVVAARRQIASRRPDVVVLDVGLPGPSGLTLCAELKEDPRTRDIGVVVLTGADEDSRRAAQTAGADAYLRKPFSPLDLLALVERLGGGLYEGPFDVPESRPAEEQLIRYAEDLRRLLELEQGQRALIQAAYRETVGALTSALEAKDTGTNAHSRRVQQYAMELAWAVEPALLERPSVEYGFLLHDVGKIGIPDRILKKPDTLTASERRILETHTVLGEQMLGGVALLQGEGLEVVRHHHERWGGGGYPDGLAGYDIPLPPRIFAVADALDAMTSDRPYRAAIPWESALEELSAEAAKQFDPNVVEAALEREPRLHAIYERFTAAVPAVARTLRAGEWSVPDAVEELPGGDPLAGDDEAWLPGDLALPEEPNAPVERSPVGFTRMLLAALVAGAAIWVAVVLLVYELVRG